MGLCYNTSLGIIFDSVHSKILNVKFKKSIVLEFSFEKNVKILFVKENDLRINLTFSSIVKSSIRLLWFDFKCLVE